MKFKMSLLLDKIQLASDVEIWYNIGMKKHTCLSIFALTAFSFAAVAEISDEAALKIARDILSRLTLEEKVSLTAGSGTMTLPSIPDKGIREEWKMSDSTHTLHPERSRWGWSAKSKGPASILLPSFNALTMTWNRDLASEYGKTIGEEALARGKNQMLGPGVNIMRTPLCGRNWEYSSEDPFLVSSIVVPEIKALQSCGVAATVKHFAFNNQEWNRHNVNVVVGERAMNEIYFPAFRAAVVDAGAWSVMTSYNKVNGEWASENSHLQRGVLRDRWHFKGMIVTDWGGQHSTVKAALAGGNVEMDRGAVIRYFANPKKGKFPLADAVRAGEVPEDAVDEMALHTLWTMAKSGFLSGKTGKGASCTPEHVDVAKRVGEEAIVLLKNDRGVLPIDASKTKKIAVIGKLATAKHGFGGSSASGNPPYEITSLDGIKGYFKEKGFEAEFVHLPLMADAAKPHDVEESVICTKNDRDLAYSFPAWETSWYADKTRYNDVATLRTYARKPGDGLDKKSLPKGISEGFAVKWHTRLKPFESGEYTFSITADPSATAEIFIGDKMRADTFVMNGTAACMERLEAGKEYDITILYFAGVGGAHRLSFGWIPPGENGSLDNLVRQAKEADAVIAFTGTDHGRGRAKESEGSDMPNMMLRSGHDKAIEALVDAGVSNLVVVNHSGTPMEFPWAAKVATIVQEPYNGQEAGSCLARVLFGDVNPSGRLSCTWPVKLSDTPAASVDKGYGKEKSVYAEGVFVGYRWYEKKGIKPLFPFGHGLSYTSFEYGRPTVEKSLHGWLVKVPVKNAGGRAGKETVQIYVAPAKSSVERPVKELKGFAKLSLESGETKTAEILLNAKDFAYWDVLTHSWRTDAGEYDIVAAASAADERGRTRMKIEQSYLIRD